MQIQKLIAVYARVSTLKQEDDGTIETQLSEIKEFAQKNNYKIVKTYSDDGWSGDNLDRPSLDDLRQDAKDAVWESVLCYDPDRLSRRFSHQEFVIEELQEKNNKEVLFVTVPPSKNEGDKILGSIRGVFSEYERLKISERMRLGKKRKIKENRVLGTGESLYGYFYHKTLYNNGIVVTHGYYTVNEEEIKIVEFIFDLIGNKAYTIRQVIDKLFELNIKPRKSKRGVWSNSTIRNMVRNTAYIGKARWGSSKAVIPKKPFSNEKYKRNKKTSKKILPKEEWQFVDMPRTIDDYLFERTQVQLEKNFANCKRNKVNQYLVSGLVFCPCGQRRCGQGTNRAKKNLYYRCNDKVTCYPLPRNCFIQGLDAVKTDIIVWDKISNLMTDEKLLTEQLERWQKEVGKNEPKNTKDITECNNAIKKIQNEIDRYNKAYGADVYTLEELKKYSEPLKEKKAKLELEVLEIVSSANKNAESFRIDNSKEKIEEMVKIIKDEISKLDFNQKRGIILKTVSKVVGTKEQLTISGYIPLNIGESINNQNKLYEQKTEYRNCWFAKCRKVYTL